jgi:hypothetical protein
MSARHERGSTMHGTRRIRKRMKLPARAVRRLVADARREGLHERDMPAWLRIVVDHKRRLHADSGETEYIFHREMLFIFGVPEGNLITVFRVTEADPDLEKPNWERIRAARAFRERIRAARAFH